MSEEPQPQFSNQPRKQPISNNPGGSASPFSGQGGSPPPNIPVELASSRDLPPQPPQSISQEPKQDLPLSPRPASVGSERVARQQPQPYNPDQRRTYLERREVQTMEKDIARVREEDAKKEQQRIAQLKAQKEAEIEQQTIERIRSSALQTKQKEETQKREELKKIQDSILPPGEERRVRDLPHPPSQGKKVFVRVVILVFFAFIALNLALFGYWYFFKHQAIQIPFQIPFISPAPPTPPPPGGPAPIPQPQPTPPPASGPINPPQAPTPIHEILKPTHTTTFQFNQPSDLSTVLSEFLNTEQQPDFTQLLFRQKPSNALVDTAAQFFALFNAQSPAALTTHFSGNSFFFSYSYERGNRIGMIVETPSSQAAKLALEQWESQMETSLSPLMSFWGERGIAYTKTFRSSAHQGVEIRFQTFSLQDYGIVYALVDKYIIFASSFEATKAAIEALQSAPSSALEAKTLASTPDPNSFKPPRTLSPQQALGQVLMIGFEGTSVTPELENLMKRLSPGGVLLLSKNIQSIKQLQQLTQDLQKISFEYSSLPLFIAVDQEGGAISRIEFGREQTPQSTIQNTDHAYRVGQGRAEELKFLGVNLNLSPVLDSTDPHDFLFERTFQAGRFETGDLAKALLAGQKDAGILSTLKHFPGYGNIVFNPEQKLATVQEFPDISPFVFALAAKPEFLLLSNVIYESLDPNHPFTFSPKGISLVRSNLNFEGLILSDDLSQPSLLNNYRLETIVEDPLKAGVNMLMFSKQSYAQEAHATLAQLAEQDPSLRKNVEDSAVKILELKKQMFSDKNIIVWNKNYSKN